MELRHLRYFIAVAEQLNFSRAAESLGTAQPSLSQQIRQLEREIGVELFARDKRNVALTPAGAEFLVAARALLAQLQTAVAQAREISRGQRGELRIAYTASAMFSTLPSAIRRFRVDRPHVRITLVGTAPRQFVQTLRERHVDVGVMLAQRNLFHDPDIDARQLGDLAIAAIVPAGHPLAARKAITIDAIGSEPLILYAQERSDLYDLALALCRARDFTPSRIQEVDRAETILGLVAAGDGVAIVPRLYERLGFRGITYLQLLPASKPLTVVVARLHGTRSPLASAFVEACAATADV